MPLRGFWPLLQLPSVAGDLKLICTIASVSASDGLRDSTIVSTPQLFSSFGVTAGSDDVVDHEAYGLAHSSVNDINDTCAPCPVVRNLS